MKKILSVLFTALAFSILQTGCGSQVQPAPNPNPAPVSSALTALTNFAWTAANAYESANTGGVLTQTIAKLALSATDSDAATTAEVLAATALADKVGAAGVAAHNAGATNQGVTNAQTALLADSGVINSTAQAAAAQASIIGRRNRALVAMGLKPLPISAADVAAVVSKIKPALWHPELVAAR
jgi:hypothetical protein